MLPSIYAPSTNPARSLKIKFGLLTWILALSLLILTTTFAHAQVTFSDPKFVSETRAESDVYLYGTTGLGEDIQS